MRIYKMPKSKKSLEEKISAIRTAERGIVILFAVFSLMVMSLLYTFQILTHWIYFVIAIPIIWLTIEGFALITRRGKANEQIEEEVLEYSIGYEKELIREIVNGVVETEIHRDDVTEAYEEGDELILISGFGEQLAISMQIEEYEDLRVRLLNWNKRKKTYDQNEKPEVYLNVGPAKINLTQSSNQPELRRRRKSYQETRMRDVRQERRRKVAESFFDRFFRRGKK